MKEAPTSLDVETGPGLLIFPGAGTERKNDVRLAKHNRAKAGVADQFFLYSCFDTTSSD
jgi:hypothetical protein